MSMIYLGRSYTAKTHTLLRASAPCAPWRSRSTARNIAVLFRFSSFELALPSLIIHANVSLISLIVHLCFIAFLALVLLRDDLDNKVRLGCLRKLLEAHVNIWIHLLEVLVFLTCEETVILAVVLDPVLRLLSYLLVDGRLFNLIGEVLALRVAERREWFRHPSAAQATLASAANVRQFLTQGGLSP